MIEIKELDGEKVKEILTKEDIAKIENDQNK